MEEKTLFDLSYDQVHRLLSILMRSGLSYKLALAIIDKPAIAKRIISGIKMPSCEYEFYSTQLVSASVQLMNLKKLNSKIKYDLRVPDDWFSNVTIGDDDNIQSVEGLKVFFIVKSDPIDTFLYGLSLIDVNTEFGLRDVDYSNFFKDNKIKNNAVFDNLAPGLYSGYLNLVAGFNDSSCNKPINQLCTDLAAGRSRFIGPEIMNIIASQNIHHFIESVGVTIGLAGLEGHDKACDIPTFPTIFWRNQNDTSGICIDLSCKKEDRISLPTLTDLHKIS